MVAQLNQNPDIIPGVLLATSAFLSNWVAALVVTGLAGAAGAPTAAKKVKSSVSSFFKK